MNSISHDSRASFLSLRNKSVFCRLGASLYWTNGTLYDKDGWLTFRRVGITDPCGVCSIPRCKTYWRLKKDKRFLAKEALKALLNRIGNLGNPRISAIMLQVFYWYSCPCVVHLRPTALLLFMFPSYHSSSSLNSSSCQIFLPSYLLIRSQPHLCI